MTMSSPDKQQPYLQKLQDRHKFPILLTYSRRPNPQSPSPTPSVSVPDPIPEHPASLIPRKRRNLPNLSECHACGFRVDLNDGNNRLQILDSEWRIVLLCKKCLNRVESSVVCSYCFEETACRDCFICNMCKRRVHKDCFLNYRCVSCCGEESSICVDCWVPKLMMSSLNRGLKRKRRVGKSDGINGKLENSRSSGKGNCVVSDQDGGENVVDCMARRKTKAFVSGKKKAKKDGGSRAMVLVATGDLNMVATRDTGDDSGVGDKMNDDNGFAFKLHSLTNSSPRILKNHEAVQRTGKSKDDGFRGVSRSLCPSINEKIQVCYNNQFYKNNADKSASESSLHVEASCCDPMIALNTKEAQEIDNMHSSQKDSKCLVTYVRRNKNRDKEGEGKGSDGVVIDLHIHKMPAESIEPVGGRSAYNADRYRLKYHKRNSIMTRIQDSKDIILQATGTHLQSQAPSAGLLSNCSNLSRTAALLSNMVPLEASSCMTGLLRDQS